MKEMDRIERMEMKEASKQKRLLNGKNKNATGKTEVETKEPILYNRNSHKTA